MLQIIRCFPFPHSPKTTPTEVRKQSVGRTLSNDPNILLSDHPSGKRSTAASPLGSLEAPDGRLLLTTDPNNLSSSPPGAVNSARRGESAPSAPTSPTSPTPGNGPPLLVKGGWQAGKQRLNGLLRGRRATDKLDLNASAPNASSICADESQGKEEKRGALGRLCQVGCVFEGFLGKRFTH